MGTTRRETPITSIRAQPPSPQATRSLISVGRDQIVCRLWCSPSVLARVTPSTTVSNRPNTARRNTRIDALRAGVRKSATAMTVRNRPSAVANTSAASRNRTCCPSRNAVARNTAPAVISGCTTAATRRRRSEPCQDQSGHCAKQRRGEKKPVRHRYRWRLLERQGGLHPARGLDFLNVNLVAAVGAALGAAAVTVTIEDRIQRQGFAAQQHDQFRTRSQSCERGQRQFQRLRRLHVAAVDQLRLRHAPVPATHSFVRQCAPPPAPAPGRTSDRGCSLPSCCV